jgi:DNA-binding PadR family transcriptional regulator
MNDADGKIDFAGNDQRLQKMYSSMQEKVIKQFIDVIILSALKNGQMSGYDLIVYIKKKYGIKISPGKVYQHLNALSRDGLVVSDQIPRKRVYEMTEDGRNLMIIMQDPEGKIVKFILTLLLEGLKYPT